MGDILWTITSLGIGNPSGRNGYNFAIELSPKLIELAMKASINQPAGLKNFNKLAVEMILHKAGYERISTSWPVFQSHEQYGVQQINHPAGDGRWLSVDYSRNPIAKGAKGSSHNIDSASQQSVLLALWTLYVNYLDV